MATAMMRTTGIPAVGDMPWGTHFCHFYQTQQDLYDTVVPYLKAGLENHELCLWVIAEALSQEIKNALKQTIPGVDEHLAAGDIEVLSYTQWYLEGDTFDPQRVLNGWNMKLAQALAKGFAGLRAAADEAWLGKKYWKAFAEYEKEIDETIAQQHMIILCAYPLAGSEASAIFDVARTHQFAVAGRYGGWETLETPKLNHAKAELKALNDKLEQRVAERTQELETINEALRHEIAERKRAQEALRATEQRFAHFMQHLPGLAWIKDQAGRYVYANDAAAKTFRRPQAELYGRTDAEIFPAETSQQFQENDRHALTDEAGILVIETLQHADGVVHHSIVSKFPIPGADGQPALVGGLAIDITERKQAEEALQASEARYRAVVEDQTELICRSRRDGTLTFVNDAYCRYFGKSRAALIGQSGLALIPETDRELVRRQVAALSRENLVTTYERRVITPDGETRWQQWTDRALFDDQNNLVEIQSVGRDITDLKLAEQAIAQAQKMESLGILAGGVAHDFNNLLVSMLGQISLVQSQLSTDHPLQTHLAKVVRAAERAADLTRQMLAYSGRGHFELQPLNLNRFIQDYLGLLEASVPKPVQLRCRLAKRLPLIEADPGQIQQVIMNLLLNAIEAIGERSGRVLISTRVRTLDAGHRFVLPYTNEPLAPGRYVTLRVDDDGGGMDADTLAKIFDPFFTTKFTGRGLGLAAVLGIVRGHKGGLQVQSRIGQGTTFTLFFPAGAVEPIVAPVATARDTPLRGTVLVIDDEAPVRDAVNDILSLEGLNVLTAADGRAGLEMYREHRADVRLVLLDLSMYGLTGEQTLAELRQIDPDVRVILSSGYSERDVISRLADRPPAGFLQKPYNLTTLIDIVRRHLA